MRLKLHVFGNSTKFAWVTPSVVASETMPHCGPTLIKGIRHEYSGKVSIVLPSSMHFWIVFDRSLGKEKNVLCHASQSKNGKGGDTVGLCLSKTVTQLTLLPSVSRRILYLAQRRKCEI